MIRLSTHTRLKPVLLFFLVLGFVFVIGYLDKNPQAQEPASIARQGYVNDFAGVVDDKTKQRLEVMLENVKLRSGIELDVTTVQTTGNKDIFEFSRQLANDWNIGARHSRKSLLLVVSVNEKTVFTQFSKSVQGELPEGILGELSQRVRLRLSSDNFSQGLSDGVDHFVASIGKRLGFTIQDIDPSSPATAAVDPAPAVPSPTPSAAPTALTEKSDSDTNVVVAPTPAEVPPTRQPTPSATRARRTTAIVRPTTPAEDEAESEEVELTLTLPLAERAVKLREFLDTHPNSRSRQRASELLISSYAGLGDESLKNGDSKGVEQLMLVVKEAPPDMSDQLFSGVISQVPLNLYLRGHRDAALEAAKIIETRFGADPTRLAAVADFFAGIEYAEEAERIAAQAVKLAPDSAEAHYALGRSLHVSLRLDEAATAFKRAVELDPGARKGSRRSLADLNRALGRAEEALALYREQLAADPTDKAARAGLVVSLLELGRNDEANQELNKGLQEASRNLALLTGAAYWFAAHNEYDRAVELARKAVAIEPRYTWAQIALARALIGQKKPLEAEAPIRFARQYGKFPTLDYELATVLAAAGLYEEAAEILLQSFTLKDGQIETRLAGRLTARETDFIKLLAPERRASFYQFAAADDVDNAAMLKALVVFYLATTAADGGRPDEAAAAAAAKEFGVGADNMRAYRQLYAANRLLKNRIALQTAYELVDLARSNINAALEVPSATVAVQAEELRTIRAQAIARGAPPDIPTAPPNVLGNLLRGRIEDTAGWALYNQEKNTEAIDHLKRAVSILPQGTPAWRDSLWHLGAAHD
ncbi:MAG: TPM domain-containing protein, partial [Pyrinomonadaceae bacterium]